MSANLKNTVSSTGIYAYGDRVSPGSNVQAVIGEVGILSQMSIRGAFV